MNTAPSLGIVVSGGPAPGINSVISAATIEACNRGYCVYGLQDGFRGITERGAAALEPLSIQDISRIHTTGGSILGTSRFNPFTRGETAAAFLGALKTKNITKLIVIGGEGSVWLSHKLSKEAPHIQIVHVPKTIDNDLVLPNKHPSFGFETARDASTRILEVLSMDAQTCGRWFIVTTMGRRAGFLALGSGLAAGTTLTIIPEEFSGKKVAAGDLADIILQSVKIRLDAGKNYGVALLAEGLLDTLIPESSPALANCPRDELGRIRYSEVELGDVLLPELKARSEQRSLRASFVEKNIGYELRCCPPRSFDLEYTHFLGLGAVELLADGATSVMVTKDFDRLSSIPLASLISPDGSVHGRTVDLTSDLYRVARRFMIRE